MRAIPFSFAALASAVLTGCAVGPDYQRPELPLTTSYIGSNAIVAVAMPDTWWRTFSDPKLDRAVERALSQNLDLAQVQARVEQQHQRQQPVHLGLVGHQLGQ